MTEKRSSDSNDRDQTLPAEDEQKPKRKRRRLDTPRNRRALALGVAASTLGGLAGAGSNAAKTTPEGEQSLAGDDPDAMVKLSIPKGWDIEPTKNEEVDFFIEFLQFKNRDKTKLWLERLGKYGPMIQQKLAERGMPQDLIWLATIESGLDPNAYSRADAAGLWQFIEETGERHGLEVSRYVDERRDPVKATDAALDYLQKLNQRFGGSWYLAAAGYNTGENRVERIVREKAGGRFGDESVFWEIDKHLPSETRDYVPVMLAMGYIGKDPAKYGFGDLERQQPLSYDQVTVEGGVKLADVAEASGVDPKQVYELNPHLIKKMTPPNREWTVRIPSGKAPVFAANWTDVHRAD